MKQLMCIMLATIEQVRERTLAFCQELDRSQRLYSRAWTAQVLEQRAHEVVEAGFARFFFGLGLDQRVRKPRTGA